MIVGPGLVIPAMYGLLVFVDRQLLPGEHFAGIDEQRPEDPPCWIIRRANGGRLPWELAPGVVLDVLERPMLDRLLRPIRPDPDDKLIQQLDEAFRDAVLTGTGWVRWEPISV